MPHHGCLLLCSFPVDASSLTGPIVVLVCLHLSWQVGSLWFVLSLLPYGYLGFWTEKPLRDNCGLWIVPPLHVNCCDVSVIQLNSGDCDSWYSSSCLKPGWLSSVRYGCLLFGRGYGDRVWALPYPQEGKTGDAFQPLRRQRYWWVRSDSRTQNLQKAN